MQRRARHLGDILPGVGKIDADAGFLRPARLPGQPEHRMGDPALDLLGRDFTDPRMRLFQALADRVQRADGEIGAAIDELRPEFGRPAQRQAFDHRQRRARIIGAAQRLGKAEKIARMDDPDDDLLAIGGDLRDLEATVDQQEKMRRRSPLFEKGFAGADALGHGLPHEDLHIGVRHFLEHGE